MSKDKVISMEDFKQTERALAEGTYKSSPSINSQSDAELGISGWTKVMLVGRGDELLVLVEQGYDENGEERSVNGVAMDYEELLEVTEQLVTCAEKMRELSTDVK